MRRIPGENRNAILRRIIAGDTFRKIQREFNVSLATIHQIKEESKAWIPDIEDLRKLSILLKKSNVDFYDTFRGANLLDRLNNCGTSLDDLAMFIEFTEELFSDESERKEKIEAAIKLKDLEEVTGKTYPELLRGFEKMSSEVPKLEKRIKILKEKERQKETQVSDLDRTYEMRKRTIHNENLTLIARKNALSKEINKDELVSNALKRKLFTIPCKRCNSVVSIRLPTKEKVSALIHNRLYYNIPCRNCGNLNWYRPDEIMIQLGWMLLPTNDSITINL